MCERMLTEMAKNAILNPSSEQQKRKLAARNIEVSMQKLLFFGILVRPLDK